MLGTPPKSVPLSEEGLQAWGKGLHRRSSSLCHVPEVWISDVQVESPISSQTLQTHLPYRWTPPGSFPGYSGSWRSFHLAPLELFCLPFCFLAASSPGSS